MIHFHFLKRHIRISGKFLITAGLLALLYNAGNAHAVTCTSIASGLWSAGATTWTGCAAGGPVAGDTVIINSPHVVSLSVTAAAAGSVTINSGGTLAFQNNATARNLTVSGNMSVSGTGAGAGAVIITAARTGANTLNVGGNLSTAAGSSVALDNAAGGIITVVVTGTFTNAGSTSTGTSGPNVTVGGLFTNSGTFNGGTGGSNIFLAGGFTNSGTFTSGTATYTFNGAGAQTITPTTAITFSSANVVINNATGTVTLAGNIGMTTNNLTVTAGTLDLATFTANRSAAGGTLTVSSGATLKIGGTNNYASAVNNYTTHTIGATSTIEYSGTNQTVSTEASQYGHLTLSGSGTKIMVAATIRGNLTIASGVTYNGSTNNPAITLQGNLTNSGTFISGTGTYTFSGAAAKTITDNTSPTIFSGAVTLNSAGGLSIAAGGDDVSIAGLLTLTAGNITTNGNTLVTTLNCNAPSVTGGAATRAVIGNLKKHIPAGVSTCTFEVGTGANYTPILLTFVAGTTAGDITGSTTGGADHSQISLPAATGGSALDSTQSVNRYWTLINDASPNAVTLPAAGYTAQFTWVAADQDGAFTQNLSRVARYFPALPTLPAAGSAWFPTFLSTNAVAQNITINNETGFGDFIVGELVAYPALGTTVRNAFDTTTAAGAVNGFITTKTAGTAFTLDIISLNGAGALTNLTATVTVDLVDASNNSGALNASNCRPTTWTTVINTTSVTFTAQNRRTTPNITQNNSYPDVRVRMTNGGTVVCSTDRFAIRPASLTFTSANVTDTDWATAGTGRTLNNSTFAVNSVVHKAGQPFTMVATAKNSAAATTINYAGSPQAIVSACTGAGAACATTLGTLKTGTWSAASGVVTTSTADYSNVGSFGLQLEDRNFALVDNDGSTPAQRNIPATTIFDAGRFVPDHFIVSTTSVPNFKTFDSDNTGCPNGRSFTYMGQPFGYVTGTSPQVTVTALNANNVATKNYQNTWWRIGTGGSNLIQIFTPNPISLSIDTSGVLAATVTPNNNNTGTGTVAANTGDKIAFVRSAMLQAPFIANIKLSMSVSDTSEGTNGTITTTTPAVFNGSGSGIDFDSGAGIRHGRMKIPNSYGSELLPLPINVSAQYWTGTTYALNIADSCTSIANGNFTVNAGPGASIVTGIQTGANTLANGIGKITLTKPSPTPSGKGSVDVSTASAISSFLPGTGRETFGIYKGGPVIYLREIY